MAPGWYPDPTGRYELRYYNGQSWTADVASGGNRHVDALGTSPSAAPVVAFRPPDVEPTNGLATAALVTGLVGVALGAILLFPLSLPLGILATIFGGIGLRRSSRVGRGRPQAITGLITGPLAVALSVFALVTLWDDLREAFHDASMKARAATQYAVTLDPAEVTDGRVVCEGRLANERSTERTFVVRLDFLPAGSSDPFATEQVTVTVAGDESERFEVDATVGSDVVRPRCAVESVRALG